eukprot:gene4174-5941_t
MRKSFLTHILILIVYFFRFNVKSSSNSNDWWSVNYSEYGLLYPNEFPFHLKLHRIFPDNEVNSCYEYATIDPMSKNIIKASSFCYPSVIISGFHKCGTTALYHILQNSPNVKNDSIIRKENCYIEYKSIVDYFDSLPKPDTSGKSKLILSGCIKMHTNLPLYQMLHKPKTFYLVMIRNYADWLWSYYNFFCNAQLEKNCDPKSRWVIKKYHKRDPQSFHNIISDSSSKHFGFHPIEHNKIFRKNITMLWNMVGIKNTLIIANEEVDFHLMNALYKISNATGIKMPYQSTLNSFTQIRYNTQVSDTSFGPKGKISLKSTTYNPGKYAASNFQPMLDQSRSLLDEGWKNECYWLSKVSGYQYNSCKNIMNNISDDSYLNEYTEYWSKKHMLMVN